MNVSNRDVLIGYILGRLSQADADAVEKQARVDSELAQTLEALRRELSDVDSFSNLRGLPNAFQRRLHTSASSAVSVVHAETKADDPSSNDLSGNTKEHTEKTSVPSDFATDKALEGKSGENPVSSSDENSKRASWDSLLSDAFASFADENAEARARAVAASRKKVKNAEIKPVSVVQSNVRRQEGDAEKSSSLNEVRNQANEARAVVDKKSSGSVSLYDVEVRTSSQPIRRRKPFEFIPKQAQAPTRAASSGFTFKHAVATSPDELEKKRRQAGRIEASSPILGERVVLARASFDFVDSIPDFSSSLVVCARVLRSKLIFSAIGSNVENSPSFSLRGGRRGFAGFFTRATVESIVDRAEDRFVALPNVEPGNFAFRRGMIDADFLETAVASSLVETSFWTLDRVEASDAYLVASLPFASSAPDGGLRRRVEKALAENKNSTNSAEETREQKSEAVEYVLPNIDEVSTLSGAVPYPETELSEAEPSTFEESSLKAETVESSISGAVPYSETKLSEAEPSTIAESSLKAEAVEPSISGAVPYSETKLSEAEPSTFEESSLKSEAVDSSISDVIPYPETELSEAEPSTIAESSLKAEAIEPSVSGVIPYPETELSAAEPSTFEESSLKSETVDSSISDVIPYPETELSEAEPSTIAESSLKSETVEPSVSGAVPYPETELSEAEPSTIAESSSKSEAIEPSISGAVPYPETELSEASSDVEEPISVSNTRESAVLDAAPATEPTKESISKPLKSRPTLAYPVVPFDVETPNSDAPEYVAPELLAPPSKRKQESEPWEEPDAFDAENADEPLLQNALIVPQRSDSYYASDDATLEDVEEYGPTLSAEDRRLAELLGHIPTSLELDEFYWEDFDESLRNRKKSATKPNAAFQILEGVFYVASAPVVFVGRAAIGIGGLFLPRRYEQNALRDSKSRLRDKRRKRDALLDVAIPCVVGVLIAVFVVFPILLRSLEYAVSTIGLDVFRRITGKVAVPSAFEENLGAVMSAKIIESQLGTQESQLETQESQLETQELQLGTQDENDDASDAQADETQEFLVVPNE